MIPLRQSTTLSCRFDRFERTRLTRNTTFLPSFLEMTILSPLLRRKRREMTGEGPRNDLLDITVARSRRFRSQQCCRFAPLFSAIFLFFDKFLVYPLANLGLSHVFAAYRSFYRSTPSNLQQFKNVGTFLGRTMSRSEVRYFRLEQT
jgi:hypothetical protein